MPAWQGQGKGGKQEGARLLTVSQLRWRLALDTFYSKICSNGLAYADCWSQDWPSMYGLGVLVITHAATANQLPFCTCAVRLTGDVCGSLLLVIVMPVPQPT
eukprot:362191-Chlamydomonas_euryale.AAC.10